MENATPRVEQGTHILEYKCIIIVSDCPSYLHTALQYNLPIAMQVLCTKIYMLQLSFIYLKGGMACLITIRT